MRTARGTTRGYEQQNDNAREDIPRELRVRGINEERWADSVRAEAEQARLAWRVFVREKGTGYFFPAIDPYSGGKK